MGAGNLPVDPSTRSSSIPADGDLALRAGSPVIDKGDQQRITPLDRNGDARVVDGDGNGSRIRDMGAFELADVPPRKTTITAGPTGLTKDNTPVFTFRSDAGKTFECQVDGGAFQPCTSPVTTTPLPDGPHTFTVRATDAVFNVEAQPAHAHFTVDTVRPDTRFTKKAPKRFFKQKVKFKFASSEAGARSSASSTASRGAPAGRRSSSA